MIANILFIHHTAAVGKNSDVMFVLKFIIPVLYRIVLCYIEILAYILICTRYFYALVDMTFDCLLLFKYRSQLLRENAKINVVG